MLKYLSDIKDKIESVFINEPYENNTKGYTQIWLDKHENIFQNAKTCHDFEDLTQAGDLDNVNTEEKKQKDKEIPCDSCKSLIKYLCEDPYFLSKEQQKQRNYQPCYYFSIFKRKNKDNSIRQSKIKGKHRAILDRNAGDCKDDYDDEVYKRNKSEANRRRSKHKKSIINVKNKTPSVLCKMKMKCENDKIKFLKETKSTTTLQTINKDSLPEWAKRRRLERSKFRKPNFKYSGHCDQQLYNLCCDQNNGFKSRDDACRNCDQNEHMCCKNYKINKRKPQPYDNKCKNCDNFQYEHMCCKNLQPSKICSKRTHQKNNKSNENCTKVNRKSSTCHNKYKRSKSYATISHKRSKKNANNIHIRKLKHESMKQCTPNRYTDHDNKDNCRFKNTECQTSYKECKKSKTNIEKKDSRMEKIKCNLLNTIMENCDKRNLSEIWRDYQNYIKNEPLPNDPECKQRVCESRQKRVKSFRKHKEKIKNELNDCCKTIMEDDQDCECKNNFCSCLQEIIHLEKPHFSDSSSSIDFTKFLNENKCKKKCLNDDEKNERLIKVIAYKKDNEEHFKQDSSSYKSKRRDDTSQMNKNTKKKTICSFLCMNCNCGAFGRLCDDLKFHLGLVRKLPKNWSKESKC